jgi:phosphatidylinositol glycan class O
MNEMIKNVTSQLQPDTILFIIGDHGMTDTGDHGGDSFYETQAALFAFAPPNKAQHLHNANIVRC